MDTILKFIMSHQYIFIIAFIFFAITMIGFFAELKRPKKPKKQDEEEAMRKKIYELKNSPLANTKMTTDENSGLKM